MAFHYDFSPGGSFHRGPWRQLLPSSQAQEMSLCPWGIGLGDSFCPTLPIQPHRDCSISLTLPPGPLSLESLCSSFSRSLLELCLGPSACTQGNVPASVLCVILSSRGLHSAVWFLLHLSPFWAWACHDLVSHTFFSEAGLPFPCKSLS